MDFPASYYGKLDRKRNPVISSFERDINSFVALMTRVGSSNRQDNVSYAKGIKILSEICRNYKHRLPLKLYQKRMLQMADFLYGTKLYQPALWQGYSLHLRHFSPVNIINITDLDHFMACFFPEGLDKDPDSVAMKIHAMQGCVQCVFELEKQCAARSSVLSKEGLSNLLKILNFIRIMMQAFQHHEHLCWHLYNGTLHIYSICRYLMTVNYSAQALEYLLWASISLELCVPLMTAKYLPWIVTLYCAVCHCYYDNQAAVQAEAFARRGLAKINDLAQLEKQSGVPATAEAQSVYREASIKLAIMMFKRAVFETRRRPKPSCRIRNVLKDFPNASWPRTLTERMLIGLFDTRAAQFLAILEALRDTSMRPLQRKVPYEPELLEVVLELLSAGVTLLFGGTNPSEKTVDDQTLVCSSALTSTSTLMDLALTGESGHQVPIMSAVTFIKMLFHYKQPDAFAELARAMLDVLSSAEGLSFRRAELELILLDRFNSLRSSQKTRCPKEGSYIHGAKASILKNSEFTGLVDILYKCVCGSAADVQPDGDLVVDAVLYLWGKIRAEMQQVRRNPEFDKLAGCLSMLCEVAFACDLATVDCLMTAEMIHSLGVLLASEADCWNKTRFATTQEVAGGGLRGLSFPVMSRAELLQKQCEVVERGVEALSKGLVMLMPQDSSSVTELAFMQKSGCVPSTPSLISEDDSSEHERNTTEGDSLKSPAESDVVSSRQVQHLLVTDIILELIIIHHKASLQLLQLGAVAESNLLNRMKNNKVSKAHFLIQKALVVYSNKDKSETRSLIEEASALIQKAEVEEKKLYVSSNPKSPAGKDRTLAEDKDNPPPPPVLLSRTHRSFTFVPAPYHMEEHVCWYQLLGRVAEGMNWKVRFGDCSLPGTGSLVPAVPGECVLKVEGLEPNQKYVFAVAAYDSQGNVVGNTLGASTMPVLASMPLSLLSTWAHLAQVAFQTEQYAVAKKACGELWSHYTVPDTRSQIEQDRLASRRLNIKTLQCSSPLLHQLFLTSIFIETEINIQQESLYSDLHSPNGLFIWEQEARVAECERMLVAMDLALWLNDSGAAIQAAVSCYGLLLPLIFHQIPCFPVVQVLKKCLIVLKENASLLKQTWMGSAKESLMHMIACITYYLSKTCRVLKEHQMAAELMDSGLTLLQEIYDAQKYMDTLPNRAINSKTNDPTTVKTEVSLHLKALHGKNKHVTRCSALLSAGNEQSRPLTGLEDPIKLHEHIFTCALKDAYQDVMKLRRRRYFIELAAQLLQRALEEGHADYVLKWGQSILDFLCRRDEETGLSRKHTEGKTSSQALEDETPLNKNHSASSDASQKRKHNNPRCMLQRVMTNREMKAVENTMNFMSGIVQCYKRRTLLRNMCRDERVWRSRLNYTVAQAHLLQFYQGLDQDLGGSQKCRYSQMNPLSFSLANSGVLLRWRDAQRAWEHDIVSERHSHSDHRDDGKAAKKVAETNTECSCTDEECSQTSGLLLDSLHSAAVHLRRAMVLAHRGSHWTTLLHVCQTMWEQSCRLTVLRQRSAQLKLPPVVTTDELHDIFIPLLEMATDLVMDMLNRLQLWSLYDAEADDELQSSLHFSVLDDSTQVDLRWVHTLVLHTLERLHQSGKWERLAHIALLFNSYTRDRFALKVTPLLVHAQRRLLERIRIYGGPTVPQPHHTNTQKATGKEVTYQSYAGSQLLSGWSNPSALKTKRCKKTPFVNPSPPDSDELKGLEMSRSLLLVCVPLDVENTLQCYREALYKRPHCLQMFQHSRSSLLLLLAYTQRGVRSRLSESQSPRRSVSVSFSPTVMPTPTVQPCDLSEEDYSAPDALYVLPISPDHLSTVTAAYSTCLKGLQANSHESLRVFALHEMGNLQFYSGNPRAARSYWNKAVDSAMQSSGVVDKWDGVSFGGGTPIQTLRRTGIWGCLQAALLTAKIAQYILISDLSQRTKCCLLSAHLFKCVLCCSLAHPQADLPYASYSIGDELLPGVDLFSEAHRVHVGATVSGLNFICQWLFITGYHIRVLPMLALYLHVVGTVCRDVHRTVEGKILKMRVLTELCLFSEAVKEAVQLTHGPGVLLPNGQYIIQDSPRKTFYNNRSLRDNAEALEELVNCEVSPEVRTQYGPTLCLRFNMARIQLILALTSTVHGSPQQESTEEAFAGLTSCLVNEENTEHDELDSEGSCLKKEHVKVLVLGSQKENLTVDGMKYLLLEGAAILLHRVSEGLTAQSCTEPEFLELSVESSLLKANMYLQQGHAALSSKMAVSSLVLLQTSPLSSMSVSKKPAAEVPHTRARTKRASRKCSGSIPRHGDCPRAVEARERTGAALWLRCRMALLRALAAQTPNSPVPFEGENISEEAAQVLQKGLDECARIGEVDTQALFMVEGAELEAQTGNKEDSMALLQEAVSLLSRRTCMPTGSNVTLARATVLLSGLKGTQSTALIKLTQKLLQKQLTDFGEIVTLNDGKMCFSPPGPKNIYLPYIHILDQTSV